MQKTLQVALCFIFFRDTITSVIIRIHLMCYNGHGDNRENWKEVVCNFGTCVKKKLL